VAVTAADIKADHSEFDAVSDAMVTRYIAKAVAVHDAEVWGSLLDLGVEWKTCDLLARAPFARDLRLQADEEKTIYQSEWERLRGQVSHAWRVLP